LEAFYAGDKSAKETADIIQNRVKLYISENLQKGLHPISSGISKQEPGSVKT